MFMILSIILMSCKNETINFIDIPQFNEIDKNEITSIDVAWDPYSYGTTDKFIDGGVKYFEIIDKKSITDIAEELFDNTSFVKVDKRLYGYTYIIINVEYKSYKLTPGYQKYGNSKTYYACDNDGLVEIIYQYAKNKKYL